MQNFVQHVHEMVQVIFRNRQLVELETTQKELSRIQADYNRRGMSSSGLHTRAVVIEYQNAVIRTVERTLEELALLFRQAGRKDSASFWNLANSKMVDLSEAFRRSTAATALQRIQTQGGAGSAGSIQRILAQSDGQFAATLGSFVANRVAELRLKSQFVTLKTPDDRRANGIPDVAVMMWFPDPKECKPEDIEISNQRYQAIVEAVADASDGLATVNKFDNPSVAPQDRISASVETWLEKAVVVVCDLGGQRHNVYYEFGFARALGTDVLLTCPNADAPEIKLHLGQWQRTEYANMLELKSKLTEKMKGLLSKYDLSGHG